MSQLPDGWTLYESEDGATRSARHDKPRVDVDQMRKVHGGRSLIEAYGEPWWSDELADLLPVLNEAATIARQWDEERDAK